MIVALILLVVYLILLGVVVWALTLVYLSLGGASATLQDSSFWAIVVRVFVTTWTVWLLTLVRRLALAK